MKYIHTYIHFISLKKHREARKTASTWWAGRKGPPEDTDNDVKYFLILLLWILANVLS